MHKFKKGDIVQYIRGNDAWVKAHLKFKVTSGGSSWIDLISLQNIPPMNGGANLREGDFLYAMEASKFQLIPKRKNHLPKWF